MPLIPCQEYREWVEEEIERPIEERIKKTRKKCKKRKCKKRCLCCNKWFCWLEDFFLTIFKWIVDIVLKEVVYIACRIIDALVTFFWVLIKWLGCFVTRVVSRLLRRTMPAPPIEHIFVLMLENRSFDHMLGFSGIRGTDARTGQRTTINGLRGKESNLTDPDDLHTKVEVNTPAEYALSEEDRDPGHEFDDVFLQVIGSPLPGDWDGRYPSPNPEKDNSGFVRSYAQVGSANPDKIMLCYAPEQLPVLVMLAREFAVCDAWFSSMPGPTWPNRYFVHGASSAGLDDSPPEHWFLPGEAAYTVGGFAFENGSIFDRLDSNCIDWEIFEGDELPQVFSIQGMNAQAVLGRFTDFSEFSERLNDPDYLPAYVFIEPNYGNILPGTPEDFTCGNSQHPLDDVTRGERLIKEVYETIRNSPHWEKSLLIITWDEHGGFYDHVSPPNAVAPGDAPAAYTNEHGFDFARLGVRVPAVAISPLIPRGTIDHTPYDHTSVLATVERLYGLRPLTNRDAKANDLLHLLSLAAPRPDALARLPEPVSSGFRCEGDPQYSAGGEEREGAGAPHEHGGPPGEGPSGGGPSGGSQAGPPNATEPDAGAQRGKTDMPPHLRGFLQVAAMKHMEAVKGEGKAARNAVIENLARINTADEARRYIASVRTIVNRTKPTRLVLPRGPLRRVEPDIRSSRRKRGRHRRDGDP